MQGDRLKKVESLIQREIGTMISQKKIKDPRIDSMMSVNRVEVSKDIAYAKVYVSSILDDQKNKKAVEALNNASGFIQKMLSKHMKTRNTPKLTFLYDTSFKEGFRINKIIEDVTAFESD